MQQLIYFRTICAHENFHKAAEELHVSQPCLSTAIAKLEGELGVYLFDRKGRHVELTKLGKFYLERISIALNELDDATQKLKKLASSDHGHVDVAFCGPMTRDLVPMHVRSFLELEENRHITFDFTQLTTPQIIEGMKEDRFDVAFCTQVQGEPNLTFVPISVQELVVITPRGHPLAKKGEVQLRALGPYPYISYIYKSGVYNLIMQLLEAYDVTPNILYTAHDEDSIAALVAAGFGVAVIANVESLQHADVAVLHIDSRDAFFNISMVYPPNQYVTPAVKRFIAYTKERLCAVSQQGGHQKDIWGTPISGADRAADIGCDEGPKPAAIL